jgi:PAS domain S-box-containing protein
MDAGVAPQVLLEAIVDMADDAILTCDLSARVGSWGTTAERVFGQTAEAVLGNPMAGLFAEHLRDDVQAVITTALAGGRIHHFETEVLRPDGMPLPVSLSFSPLLDGGGHPVGAVVIARDVTEQHLAQATLAEIDARIEEGEALAHVGSWLWDLRTGVVQWSAEFHRIHGVDPLEFDGTFDSYMASLHAEDREKVRKAMVESVRTGRPFNIEYRIDHPTRSGFVVQIRARPTFGSAGRAIGLRGIGHVVTDRPDTPGAQPHWEDD